MVLLAGWHLCCGGSHREAQGPQEPEPPRTADDQVIGADGVSPSQKLKQGVRVGSEGVQPATGWSLDGKGLHREREEHTNRGRRSIDAGPVE